MTTHPDKLDILLVDDKPNNLLALEAVLEDPAYNLVRAGSGEHALRETLHHDFALILLDAQMPVMDGFEVANLLRSRERTADIPIIFITAVYTDVYHAVRGYKLGAVDFVTKPFDPDLLKAKVAVFAELRRRARTIGREREERQRAEATRGYYQDLVDRLAHSVIWEAEAPDLRFLFVSQRAEEILGYPVGRWHSEPGFFLDLVHEDDRAQVRSMLESAQATGRDFSCEHRMCKSDGTVLWLHTGIQLELLAGVTIPPKYKIRGLSVEIPALKDIEEEQHRREHLIEDLFDIARIASGHLPVEKSDQDITLLVSEVEKIMRPAAQEKSIQISMELRTDGVRSCFDRNRIFQVFSNLIGNAIKVSPENGLIRVEAELSDGEVQFCISNQGPGIPQSEQSGIFDRFWQGKSAEKSGSGLGLAIAKGIVEAHGGKIWVESEVGSETRIYFSLPALTASRRQCA